jgi:hypothetical protein
MGSKYVSFYELEYFKKAENYGGESTLYRLVDEKHIFKRFKSDLGTSILKSKQRNLDELLNIKELRSISIMPDSMVVTFDSRGEKLVGTIMEYHEVIKPLSLMNFNYQIEALKKIKKLLYKLEELNVRHFDLKIDNILYVTKETRKNNIINVEEQMLIGDMDSASYIGVKTDYSSYDRLLEYFINGGTDSFNAEIYLYNLMTYELLIKPFVKKSDENRLLGYELTNPRIDTFCDSLINKGADQIADHEFLIDYVAEYVKKI